MYDDDTPNCDALVLKLRARAEKHGWKTPYALGIHTGIPMSTLRDFWNDSFNPRLSTLRKLEKAMRTGL